MATIRVKSSDLEAVRKVWERIASANGWTVVGVQFWLRKDGTVADAIATKDMWNDVFLDTQSNVVEVDIVASKKYHVTMTYEVEAVDADEAIENALDGVLLESDAEEV